MRKREECAPNQANVPMPLGVGERQRGKHTSACKWLKQRNVARAQGTMLERTQKMRLRR